MATGALEVGPGPNPRTVRDPQGKLLEVPEGWELLPPGDAGLTRRVKKAGPSWTVKQKKGRRVFSQGVWAPAQNIEEARAALADERSTPEYARKLEAGRQRRAQQQQQYAEEFEATVLAVLDFAPRYQDLATVLAEAIADHATPVGSGTVARTERIPIERRAEAATIAWLRHQTTAYDSMKIPRVAGARRETRRLLAEQSRRLLAAYRRGDDVDPADCPLRRALLPFD